MKTVVQINIYRRLQGRYEYLLLKTIATDDDEPVWQPVSQTVPATSTPPDTLKLAIQTQTGIHSFMRLDKELFTYDWFSHDKRGRDLVFAGEVDANTPVLPDLTVYTEFAWLPAPEARLKLKWDGNKQAILELQRRLEQEEPERQAAEAARAANLAATSAAAATANVNAAANAATDPNTSANNPAGDQTATGGTAQRPQSQRLPNTPEDGPELTPYHDMDEYGGPPRSGVFPL